MSPQGRGFLDAAYQVLSELGRPVHGREIVQACLERGLWETSALDPNLAGTTTLYSTIRRGANSRGFTVLGNGRFGLKEWDAGTELTNQLSESPVVQVAERRPQISSELELSAQPGGSQEQTVPSQRPNPAKHKAGAPASTHAGLDALVTAIQDFLNGRYERPSDERLCDWVSLCYEFGLFKEGVELFRLVDPAVVNPWYYERTRRLARICNMKTAGQA